MALTKILNHVQKPTRLRHWKKEEVNIFLECRLFSYLTCLILLLVCKIDLYNLLHWNLDPSSLVPEVYWFELFSYGHIGLGYWASNLIMLQNLEQNMFNISVLSVNQTCIHHIFSKEMGTLLWSSSANIKTSFVWADDSTIHDNLCKAYNEVGWTISYMHRKIILSAICWLQINLYCMFYYFVNFVVDICNSIHEIYLFLSFIFLI
mgnify:CR=1 FL=1